MNSEALIKHVDLERIATQGMAIYREIKDQYEPQKMGSFLAIDVDEKKAYTGTTSADAVALARQSHPDKVFYVVKIGFDAAETMAQALFNK